MSLQGQFLVASPRLPDPNFYRSVVLMVHHSEEEGALGVILNRPSNFRLCDVWEEATERPCESTRPIYMGGPVEGPPMGLHRLPDFGDHEVLPGVFFTSDLDDLQHVVQCDDEPFRLFSGYGGWSPGQLEGELEAGGWLTLPATDELIFADDEDLWKRVAQQIGLEILTSVRQPLHVPNDASMN